MHDARRVAAAQDGAAMADGALWLYHLAFQELQRSIASECRQRGELLGACWCPPPPPPSPRGRRLFIASMLAAAAKEACMCMLFRTNG